LDTAEEIAGLLQLVTVVSVTYNSSHCIPSMARALQACPHVSFVDNASADETVDAVKRLLPAARLQVFPENRGYGAANNAAIAAASTRYVLLLNPDCLADTSQIAEMVRHAEADSRAVMWVPQLLDGAGREQINYGMPRHWGRPRGGAAEGPLCVGYACAAVMLMHRERMKPLGFFDPRFFLYYEDEDLCLRAFDAGAAVVVLPQVRVAHLSRGSVRGPRPWISEYWRGWHHAQSKVRFAAKHHGIPAGSRLLDASSRNAWLHVGARLALPLSVRLFARAMGRLRGLRALQDALRQKGAGPTLLPHDAPDASSAAPVITTAVPQSAVATKPRLTIGVLTLNEERHIRTCLQSAAFADELLVIDSGSTDRTLDIAREHGAVVHAYPDWQGFAAQRNRLLQHATGDYVFFVDADEEITDRLRDEVQQTVSAGVDCIGTIRWTVIAFGKELKWFLGQSEIERFFPRRLVREFVGVVHERADMLQENLPRQSFSGRLRHTSRESIHDSLNKMTQYAMLGAAKRAAWGRRGGVWRGIASGSLVFLRLYILRLGFLGGGPGFLFCLFIALESFFRYAALHYDREQLRTDVGR
jgi:GT2 family glycosyltransferase